MKKIFLVLFLILIVHEKILAADKDDIYFTLDAGILNKDDIKFWNSKLYYLSAKVGYLVRDEIGFGLVLQQDIALDQEAQGKNQAHVKSALIFAPEFRWFLEPFELAIAAGWSKRYYFDASMRNRGVILLNAVYQIALNSSMTWRLEAGMDLPLGVSDENGFLLGNGFRILF